MRIVEKLGLFGNLMGRMQRYGLVTSLILILSTMPILVHGGFVVDTGPQHLRPPPQYPKILVLAVGINQYASPYAPSLSAPERETRLISDALTDHRVGLTLRTPAVNLLGMEATKKNILLEARRLANTAEKNDIVVIYWSGLAGHAPDGHKNLALYAYDADLNSDTGTISITDDLFPIAALHPDVDFVFIMDGCNIGDPLLNKFQSARPNISVISASKNDEPALELPTGSPFTAGLLKALQSVESDLDGDGVISVEEAYIGLYPYAAKIGSARAHPSIVGSRVHRVPLVKVPSSQIMFDDPVPQELLASRDININGNSVELNKDLSTSTKLVLLGNPSGLLVRGMNYIGNAKKQVAYWRESEALKQFTLPYIKSAAVLVAINDYERKLDPQKRGSTGFESRPMMVERAKELKTALIGLGFPDQNIIELYDQQATSQAIDAALKRFWRGAEGDQVDRLVFYFGGHGTTVDGAGLLVTYDFEAKTPTQTSLLMRDLSTRQAENIVAKQVLIALDACASGLAVYRGLGDTSPQAAAPNFDALSIIRNDTSNNARNFLVAGTKDQPALWDQGGIFTQTLIDGLKGDADMNKDGLIQFSELSTYVTNKVSGKASRLNVRQQVQSYSLDMLGTGKMLFIKPTASTANNDTNLYLNR